MVIKLCDMLEKTKPVYNLNSYIEMIDREIEKQFTYTNRKVIIQIIDTEFTKEIGILLRSLYTNVGWHVDFSLPYVDQNDLVPGSIILQP